MTAARGISRRIAPGKRAGTALFAVVPITILVMAMMVAFVGTSVETSRANVADMDQFRARAAAQNAAAIAATSVWGDFSAAAGDNAQLWNLRAHLDKNGIPDQAQAKGKPDRCDILKSVKLPKNTRGRQEVDGAEIERLDVYRIDEFDATTIVIEVDAVVRTGEEGNHREARASVQEVFTIAPPEWEGLDYAMLANNINCLLCHTSIDNAERVYNQNTSLAGSYDAVKIGSLDSIHFRSDPDSRIAGVALIGGDAIQGDGEEISDWSAFNLKTAEVAGGMIVEDKWLDPVWEKLSLFDADAPEDSASVYLDFYENQGLTDFTLPNSFPSPFPDNGGVDPATGLQDTAGAGNRIVDDFEFQTSVGGSKGRISGGNIAVIAKGDRITSDSDRAKMSNGNTSAIAGVTDGNVFLHGTKGNPIVLDGDIAIDGDVILSGYVVGAGTIQARGNVYVPGDLKYLDGGNGSNRTFGTAADGRTNSLAVASGGNIVIGDFYRPAWGKGATETGEPGSSFNFTMDELAIFNRAEWMKTQPTLPGESVYEQTSVKVTEKDEKVKEYYWKTVDTYSWVKTGNKIKKPKYKWIWVSNGKSGAYEEKVKKKVQDGWKWVDEKKKVKTGTKEVKKSRWVKTGNKVTVETPVMGWVTPQHDNPYYVPNHVPRYYSFGEGTTVPIFNKDGHFDPETKNWKSDEIPSGWDKNQLSYADVDDKGDPYLYDSNGKPKAVVSTVAPTADWITPAMMQKVIQLAQNGGGDKTVDIDATLYSSNAILGTIPARASTHTDGTLIVNGSIVAADIGILAPNGTQVNYDARGSRALSITSDSGVEIRRRLTAPLPNM